MRNISFLIIFILLFSIACKKQDTTSYTPLSTTVVAVNILNNSQDTVFLSSKAYTLLPSQTVVSQDTVTTESGRYYLELAIDRPLRGGLIVNKKYFNVMMIPFDTTYVAFDFKDGSPNITYKGKNQTIYNYFLDKEKYLGYSDHRNPLGNFLNDKSTYGSLKRKIDSTTKVAISFLTNYQELYNLPAWFYELEYNEMRYGAASFKSSVASYNKRFKVFDDTLTDQYYDYMDVLKIDNQQAVYSDSYFRFLDGYFLRDLPEEYDEYSGFQRSTSVRRHILKSSKQELSGLVKEVYHKWHFSKVVRYYADANEIDSVAKAFDIKDYEPLLANSGSKSGEEKEIPNLVAGDTVPGFYVTNAMDSVVSIRDYSDKIVYINFWATWCRPCIANAPALNQMIAEFEDDDNVVFLNICLDSKKEKWPAIIAEHNIQGENLFAEGNWNSKIKSYFNINGIPQYVILRQGNVLEQNFANKAPLVQSKLVEILNASTSKTL